MPEEHVPVLAAELIDRVAPGEGDLVVDATFGSGGHARLVAERIGPSGTLICIDRDPAAAERFEDFARDVACETRFIDTRFDTALRQLAAEGVGADVVYFDLGVSSMQIDAFERGFSYSFDAPLDMRMDTRASLTAAEIVNEWPEPRLAEIIRSYGDERRARSIARQIVARRPLTRTSELVDAVTRPRAPTRRSGSPSMPSWRPSTRRCPRRGHCSLPVAAWQRSRFTRTRIAGSSGSSPTSPAAASVRRSCPSAAAVTSPRQSP
jgi:16S rRNA (cytosine1402-N4)-methyltransferase